MHSLKVLKNKYTFPEAVERAVNFRPPLIRNDQHLYTEYAQASDRLASITSGLEAICKKHLDFEFSSPGVDAFDAAAAALPYAETLDAMQRRLQGAITNLATSLDVPKVGHILWTDGDSCRFTYFDIQRDRGILNNTVRRVTHQHDLVNARQHRWPASEVPMPKRARQIICAIPEPLQRYTRVITGLEVRKEIREESRRQERTWLGDALDTGKRHALATARAAGTGVVAAGSVIATGLSGALALLSAPLAVADPAIVVGQVVLYGWETP